MRFLLFFLLIFSLLSCQKEATFSIDYKEFPFSVSITDGIVNESDLWLTGGQVWKFGSFSTFSDTIATSSNDSITYGFLKTMDQIDSSKFITSGMDGILRVYFPKTKGVYFIDKTQTPPVNCVKMHPDKLKGISVGGGAYLHGHIHLFDLKEVYKKHNLSMELNHVNYSSASEVWVSGVGIVLHSDDSGEHFDTTNIIGDNFIKTFFNQETGYAIGSFGSIWTSLDKGKNWEEITNLKKHIYSKNTISDALYYDSKLWIVGDNGLLAYSENLKDWAFAENLPTYKFNRLLIYQNKLWILTNNGLIRLDK